MKRRVLVGVFALALILIGTVACELVTDVNGNPVAVFGVVSINLATGEVEFSAEDSTDADGTIVSYAWVFGDGSSGSGESVTHIYSDSGEYDVVLTVTDNEGGADSCSVTVTMTIEGDLAPIATFTYTNDAQTPSLVTFDATGSYDPDGRIVRAVWRFDDGTVVDGGWRHYHDVTAAENEPEHYHLRDVSVIEHQYDPCYEHYAVELVVYDNNGNSDSTIRTVHLSHP